MDNPQNETNGRERDSESGAAATADELQRRQRGSLPSFLFITFLFFMLTNRNEEGVVGRSQYEDAVRALGYQLSNYSAWLNDTATNFALVRSHSHFLCHIPDSSPSSPSARYTSNDWSRRYCLVHIGSTRCWAPTIPTPRDCFAATFATTTFHPSRTTQT